MPKVDRLNRKRELQRVRRARLNPDVRRTEQTNDTESRRVETSGHYKLICRGHNNHWSILVW